ncbi:MAG: hypothetical protein EBT03_12910 [Betaproteobacteria bacterium]|nr:hypothetical protein [Betaproteobacteria bacterium]
MAESKPRFITVEWSDLKHRYLDAVENGTKFTPAQPINEKITRWHNQPMKGELEDFEGGSPAQTCKYLRSGYRAEQFAHSAEYAALSHKRHFYYNEDEGELDLDRVLDGHDEIFLDREMRESRPGLRLMVEFSFVHYMDAVHISEYGAWVASLIKSLEASGYDLVVDMWINLDGLFMRDGGRRSNVLIRVKRENEQSNFTDWSALFGPTGYRHLGFLAKCMAADQEGLKVTPSFGQCIRGKDWGVTYDRDNQQVTINVNQISNENPVPKLNESAIEEGLIPRALKVSGASE